MKQHIINIKGNSALYAYVRRHSVTYHRWYSRDGEIRCWRPVRYAVDQEKPCSLFQILLPVEKNGGGGIDPIDLAKDR